MIVSVSADEEMLSVKVVEKSIFYRSSKQLCELSTKRLLRT